MKNRIRLTNFRELERLLGETVINNTEKINKISPNSVNSAIIAGNAKVASKGYNELAISISPLFPDTAVDEKLDESAELFGISPRLTATKSSVPVQFYAEPGTVYLASEAVIAGNRGVSYQLTKDVTVGDTGIAFGEAKSIQTGSQTKVEAFELYGIQNEPVGHFSVTNLFASTGGRDLETDEQFRERISKSGSGMEAGTAEKYAAIFRLTNPNILRVFKYGAENGKIRLALATVNGEQLTQNELDQLLEASGSYFSISEINQAGQEQYGIQLENVQPYYIDLDFRCEIYQNFNFVEVIKDMQTALLPFCDPGEWKPGESKIEWDELLSTVRSVDGVKQVVDSSFSPRVDIEISYNQLPRFRGFRLRDLQGSVIVDQNTVQPAYYPAEPLSFVSTLF